MQRLTILVLFTLIISCTQSHSQSEVLEVKTFNSKLLTTQDKIILDVRTSEEYSQGHLDQAVQIDYYKDDFKEQLKKFDKAKPVFVYCAAGSRSGRAAEILVDLGFKKVYDLDGGMRAWKGASMPVIK